MDLDFADFDLSFLLSGEEERLTEMLKKEEKGEKAGPVNESSDANTSSRKVDSEHRKGCIMVKNRRDGQITAAVFTWDSAPDKMA